MHFNLLFIYFVHIKIIQCTLNVPVGFIFHGYDEQLYTRMNSLAREFVFNKIERDFQYNIIEIVDTPNSDNCENNPWSTLCNQLSNGVMSIIGHINSNDLDWLSAFCSPYQIPFLNLDNNNHLRNNFSISLMPDILSALITIIRHYQITQLVYIFDGIDGAHRLKQLIQIQTSNVIPNLNIISRYLDNPDDSYDLLQSVEIVSHTEMHTLSSIHSNPKTQYRYIVLDFHTFDTYRIMLDKIKHRSMTTSYYHYILLTLNAKQLDMTYFHYGGVNVTFFTLPSYYDQQTNQNYIDLLKKDKLFSVESLLLADAWETLLRTINHMLNSTDDAYEQLKVFQQEKISNELTQRIDCQHNYDPPWLPGNTYLEHILNTKFQGLTGNVQFSHVTGQRINYTFDVYRLAGSDMPKRIGFFRAPDTLEVADNVSYQYRMLFDNRTRLIVTIFDEPFMMLKRNSNDTLTERDIPRGTILDPSRVEGFCVDLAYAICHDRLKLPYKFLIETKYGKEIEKGIWDGMIGALVNRDADLAIASLTINGAREKAVDFSKSFIDLGISIMISKPEKQKPGVFSFMDPLSTQIWICVIVSYLFVSGILFFISRFSPYEWYFENESDLVPRNKFSLHNALFFSFAAFMHQGVDLLPRSMSGRVVTSAWWFFSLILVSSYTANLAAFLTVENLVPPIETVEDLAKQTDIHYGTLKGGATMAFFNKSTLTTFKIMWDFMQQHKDDVFVSSNSEGIEKVRGSKGKFAFLLESTLNEYVNERAPCDTMRIGENIDSKGYGIATPLGSDLREAINIAVLELTESGFLERLKQKWYYERSQCTNSGSKDSKQSTPLNLANVAGMFYVLIIGLGTAMVIAFIEFLFKAKLDSKRLNQNIREVMRRNLRISITGIDFDEKLHKDEYWPLKQQQLVPSSSFPQNILRNERTPTKKQVHLI
ncbi:unnamed protein product [Rotaria sp. Silwood2]|nr:unnamed protein product [Rotaria sp. Silwood2]CAF3006574.1 unnamed protein product [Rotaria sp. Silwood2]CAF4149860.1 unnamed protein product [Rotaria sp. Silwood2]CAF4202379.1 unnamed protein product [Rotaria sp. Silwood2]